MDKNKDLELKMKALEAFLQSQGIKKFFGHMETEDGIAFAYEFGKLNVFERYGVCKHLENAANEKLLNAFK